MLHHHPGASARYEFICRNPHIFPLKTLAKDLEKEVEHLTELSFSEDELQYLRTIPYFKEDFINFLKIFRLQKDFVTIQTQDDNLQITIEGPQVHITIFEIYLLAIISELYNKRVSRRDDIIEGRKRLRAKIEKVKAFFNNTKPTQFPFEFFDFGTRRRYSLEWQYEVVNTLHKEIPNHFRGTSSLYLSKLCSIHPIGTLSHEYFQSHQAYGVQLRQFQKTAMEEWVQEYRGDLGIALTDTIGIDAFIRDFDLYFAKLFDGLRHDSGDPINWGEKCIAHYLTLGIEPSTKKLVFSDNLNIDKALAIHTQFSNRIKCGFGIGTNLTNDVGIEALNIVIKNIYCNGQPTGKISDDPNKTICPDQSYLEYLKKVFSK